MMQMAGKSVVVAVVVVSAFAVTTTAHMLGLGSCRTFEGMQNFDSARFNGTWYVISKIGTRSDCLTVNYNLMGDDQSFRIEEMRRPPYADVTPLDMVVTNAGMLNRLGAASKYTVTWFNGIIPVSGTYTLVDTDYDTFAIDYECQKYSFIRRVSATILSRTPEMDATKLDELKSRLVSEFDVPGDRLNRVAQDSCIPLEENDFNIVVDEEGITSAQESQQTIIRLSKLPQEEAEKEISTL